MQHTRTDDFKSNSSIALKALEHELADIYAGLAVLVNDTFMPGAGTRMLSAEKHQGALVNAIDVSKTVIGKMLPTWHSYGYDAVAPIGFDPEAIYETDGPLEQLRALLNTLHLGNEHFDAAMIDAGALRSMGEPSVLRDLLWHVECRVGLDTGSPLHTSELATLAGMSERSVRNAVSAEGEGRLVIDEDGRATNEEAKRWLRGRRGFTPTTFRELPADLGHVPDALLASEIPGFIGSRLFALEQAQHSQKGGELDSELWHLQAAQEAGLTLERLAELKKPPLAVQPAECFGLAKVLKVPVAWFNHQVMTALFPAQVDMLLNPTAWDAEDQQATPAEMDSVTVTLTDAMLRNGYLDIPAAATSLFPSDCLGDRGGAGTAGQEVELVYGSNRAKTDIRVKSIKTISPRKRFSAWFNTQLNAKPGDRIRIEKTADRVFTLVHVPV